MSVNSNSGKLYGFFTLETMMGLVGIWPLQQKNALHYFQWLVASTVLLFSVISIMIESFKNCGIPRDSLDILRMLEINIHAWTNVFFTQIYLKKIAVNLKCAIDDWSSLSTKGESRVIMATYAYISRMVILFQLLFGIMTTTVFFVTIFLENKHKVVKASNDTGIVWTFVFPSTCLYKGVSYSTYKAIFVMQIMQCVILLIGECACNSFIFSITMHLCGQLEVLKIRFNYISRKCDDEKCHSNILIPLVKRHCQLIKLAKNIDDAFHISILLRLILSSVVIASSGVELIISLRNHNHSEVIKMLTCFLCYFLYLFIYIHAGDTLHNQSVSIFFAIYDTTWYKLSPTMMKDLLLIMARAKIPLRLSAGKFFYLTRPVMTDVLKTTLTFISFLQIAI